MEFQCIVKDFMSIILYICTNGESFYSLFLFVQNNVLKFVYLVVILHWHRFHEAIKDKWKIKPCFVI
jgi:hypothetical protein